MATAAAAAIGQHSKAEILALATPQERAAFFGKMTAHEADMLFYDWDFWARPKQQLPEQLLADLVVAWLIMAGRGFGKTRVGAEVIRRWQGQGFGRFALVGQTPGEVRDVMIEGPSGILATSPPWNRPDYEPSKKRLTWPNGAIATAYSAENPEVLRGPQHEKAWIDELAKMKHSGEVWENLLLGLRLGRSPQVIVTTTPKPIPLIKDIIAGKEVPTVVTTGTTFENIGNLSPVFFNTVVKRYEGTTLGRQELYAQLLDDNPGALWNRAMIEADRITKLPEDLARIVVGVDPATTSGENADEVGIVVGGVGKTTGEGYILDDLSLRGTPNEWAAQVVAAYHKWKADRVVGEVNNGGDLVEAVIRAVDRAISYRKVHASRGKAIRAEPIVALYEKHKIHHVGTLKKLEDELCQWDTTMTWSPNRLDALVWTMSELMLKQSNWGW